MNRITISRELLERLAPEPGPADSEGWECPFCEAKLLKTPVFHDDDCAWVQARALLAIHPFSVPEAPEPPTSIGPPTWYLTIGGGGGGFGASFYVDDKSDEALGVAVRAVANGGSGFAVKDAVEVMARAMGIIP